MEAASQYDSRQCIPKDSFLGGNRALRDSRLRLLDEEVFDTIILRHHTRRSDLHSWGWCCVCSAADWRQPAEPQPTQKPRGRSGNARHMQRKGFGKTIIIQ